MPRLDRQYRLPDGRRLGFNEYGSSDGMPIFYFHGSPSARIEFALFGDDALMQSLSVRLISVDRPGIGLSDYQANRRLLDFPNDVLMLANYLNIGNFAVLAYSLGGPYGLACAYAIPERLTSVGIVSGAALFTEPQLMESLNKGTRRYIHLPRENPLSAKLFLWMMKTIARLFPKLMITNAKSLLSAADQAVMSDPEIQHKFTELVREAFRQGTRGVFRDSLLSITDYGFKLQEIQIPVHLWHGEMDHNIPLTMARFVESSLRKCKAMFYPNEGHLSLFKKNITEIIGTLISEKRILQVSIMVG